MIKKIKIPQQFLIIGLLLMLRLCLSEHLNAASSSGYLATISTMSPAARAALKEEARRVGSSGAAVRAFRAAHGNTLPGDVVKAIETADALAAAGIAGGGGASVAELTAAKADAARLQAERDAEKARADAALAAGPGGGGGGADPAALAKALADAKSAEERAVQTKKEADAKAAAYQAEIAGLRAEHAAGGRNMTNEDRAKLYVADLRAGKPEDDDFKAWLGDKSIVIGQLADGSADYDTIQTRYKAFLDDKDLKAAEKAKQAVADAEEARLLAEKTAAAAEAEHIAYARLNFSSVIKALDVILKNDTKQTDSDCLIFIPVSKSVMSPDKDLFFNRTKLVEKLLNSKPPIELMYKKHAVALKSRIVSWVAAVDEMLYKFFKMPPNLTSLARPYAKWYSAAIMQSETFPTVESLCGNVTNTKSLMYAFVKVLYEHSALPVPVPTPTTQVLPDEFASTISATTQILPAEVQAFASTISAEEVNIIQKFIITLLLRSLKLSQDKMKITLKAKALEAGSDAKILLYIKDFLNVLRSTPASPIPDAIFDKLYMQCQCVLLHPEVIASTFFYDNFGIARYFSNRHDAEMITDKAPADRLFNLFFNKTDYEKNKENAADVETIKESIEKLLSAGRPSVNMKEQLLEFLKIVPAQSIEEYRTQAISFFTALLKKKLNGLDKGDDFYKVIMTLKAHLDNRTGPLDYAAMLEEIKRTNQLLLTDGSTDKAALDKWEAAMVDTIQNLSKIKDTMPSVASKIIVCLQDLVGEAGDKNLFRRNAFIKILEKLQSTNPQQTRDNEILAALAFLKVLKEESLPDDIVIALKNMCLKNTDLSTPIPADKNNAAGMGIVGDAFVFITDTLPLYLEPLSVFNNFGKEKTSQKDISRFKEIFDEPNIVTRLANSRKGFVALDKQIITFLINIELKKALEQLCKYVQIIAPEAFLIDRHIWELSAGKGIKGKDSEGTGYELIAPRLQAADQKTIKITYTKKPGGLALRETYTTLKNKHGSDKSDQDFNISHLASLDDDERKKIHAFCRQAIRGFEGRKLTNTTGGVPLAPTTSLEDLFAAYEDYQQKNPDPSSGFEDYKQYLMAASAAPVVQAAEGIERFIQRYFAETAAISSVQTIEQLALTMIRADKTTQDDITLILELIGMKITPKPGGGGLFTITEGGTPVVKHRTASFKKTDTIVDLIVAMTNYFQSHQDQLPQGVRALIAQDKEAGKLVDSNYKNFVNENKTYFQQLQLIISASPSAIRKKLEGLLGTIKKTNEKNFREIKRALITTWLNVFKKACGVGEMKQSEQSEYIEALVGPREKYNAFFENIIANEAASLAHLDLENDEEPLIEGIEESIEEVFPDGAEREKEVLPDDADSETLVIKKNKISPKQFTLFDSKAVIEQRILAPLKDIILLNKKNVLTNMLTPLQSSDTKLKERDYIAPTTTKKRGAGGSAGVDDRKKKIHVGMAIPELQRLMKSFAQSSVTVTADDFAGIFGQMQDSTLKKKLFEGLKEAIKSAAQPGAVAADAFKAKLEELCNPFFTANATRIGYADLQSYIQEAMHSFPNPDAKMPGASPTIEKTLYQAVMSEGKPASTVPAAIEAVFSQFGANP